jgi:hypothetical protein
VEDVRRLQAVNGDCLRSALNLYGIGLIAPVEDQVWADIRGLEGPRRAPCRRKTCEAVPRSLNMKADGAAYRDAGTGQSFPMWPLSLDAKSVHAAGEGAKKSPGNRRGEPYISSADEAFKSSVHALRIPSRTKGRALAQCSWAWHMRAAFS